MSPRHLQSRIKVFWPNVGGLEDYPESTYSILGYIRANKPSRREAIRWVGSKFNVVQEFARKLLLNLA